MTDFDGIDTRWLHKKRGIKWAWAKPGELAAWVADMDFPIPAVVADALHQVVDGLDLGYPDLRSGPPLADAFVARTHQRFGISLSRERVRQFDDILNALQAVLSVSVQPGKNVAIHTPAYPPFLDTIERMGFEIAPIPYICTDAGWKFDQDQAAGAIAAADAFILVNPHNPTGRVLTRDELMPLVQAATDHQTVVISDEVHAELVYPGATHIPIADLHPQAVTVTSATKAFNLAGIRCAVAHIGSDLVWEGLQRRPEHLFGAVSNLSIAATLAAWSGPGDEWLSELLVILHRNRERVADRLHPDLRHVSPEATYLAWIDTSATSLRNEPATEIRRRTGLVVSPGRDFGPLGNGFVRLNFATSRDVLDDALGRLNLAAIG